MGQRISRLTRNVRPKNLATGSQCKTAIVNSSVDSALTRHFSWCSYNFVRCFIISLAQQAHLYALKLTARRKTAHYATPTARATVTWVDMVSLRMHIFADATNIWDADIERGHRPVYLSRDTGIGNAWIRNIDTTASARRGAGPVSASRPSPESSRESDAIRLSSRICQVFSARRLRSRHRYSWSSAWCSAIRSECVEIRQNGMLCWKGDRLRQ